MLLADYINIKHIAMDIAGGGYVDDEDTKDAIVEHFMNVQHFTDIQLEAMLLDYKVLAT